MERFALISVSDKTDVVKLAKSLRESDYKIIATGNTAKHLNSSGIEVTEISDITGFKEIFDGRVKTIHPKIFGGILMRRDNPGDIKQAEENKIFPIDVVCVNLYPFVKTTQKPDVTQEEVIEQIDIGGPSLIRASAKNYNYVSVLTNPTQYDNFISEVQMGKISEDTRKKLAVEAFSHTANYDTYISNYLEEKFELPASHIRINYPLEKTLRYGENPHQNAEIYGNFGDYFEVFHGKELSYNNILDLISAVELVEDLGANSCAIIKHNNPAGAAKGSSLFEAYEKALKCDPVSAFGGIVSFTTIVDELLAQKLNEIFLEIVCAPKFTEEAVKILQKKKDRRLLRQLKSVRTTRKNFKNIPGGVIVQDTDLVTLSKDAPLKFVTDKKPSEQELNDLLFAWIIAKHTKSNAIVFAKDGAALGVGAGQMSRLDSSKIAHMKAQQHGLDLKNSVAASDAFFPFADGLLEIIKCGATSIIQPGGSVRDQEVINAANEHNVSMVFTGIRHFKH
ncbi:MAG TPA: bifunctional phosphoribosylaminoimidazolecarboxamide formyltransferase/IMP cyclohydrolase [Ignavibacteriaceae bacterium]|nr:bifunctional phosphoribosylaminoimidazolecarboxamide formyltransferase/IMP cyclohydrolase [Ignavibacteriaceae bacterium]